MKDEQGRAMVRLGDWTDHGGMVIEAARDLSHMGIAVALNGHLAACPKCGGKFPILATGRMTHRGVAAAYDGDKTGCGAVLIASA
ncbi:PAAR domain-containing protein [Paraburkholderia fungorum]|uniref:PAAR domain-containing protein n=1 Tax=Paraburkholderia fungorum TaxID=134537 RepID=UPI0038B8BBC5